jgi:Bacterial Ig-like domain (group 3)
MPFMLLPDRFAPWSRRSPRYSHAKDRRRYHLSPIVTPLEERQLLTTPTLISVAASAASLTFGQSEVFQATVVANPPGGTPPTGGTVTFNNGATVIGTASLVNGTASLSTTLAAGTYSVTATYGGTATYAGSTSTTSAGYIFNQAGNGTFGNTVTIAGGAVAATSAELANPYGVAVGPAGTIYIADTFNNQIDAVNPNTGLATVIAGNGTYGDVDGSALSAEFASPRGLAYDAPLNALFIADRDNNTIRELNLKTGVVTTVAGTGTFGDGGSNMPATSVALANPNAVAVNANGLGLFIADTFNNVVREVNLTTSIITTIAGTGTAGYSGDGGLATSADLYDPSGLAVASNGNVFIGDAGNFVVREVTASTGIINTIAGTGTFGYSGNNGPATSAELGSTYGLALNTAGTTLYIADGDNNAIRDLNLTTGIITTIAGDGAFGPTGNGGSATAAALASPRSVAVDAAGDVFIADTLGNEIRMVAGGQSTATVTVTPFAAIAPGRTTVFSTGVPTGVGRRTAQGIVLALPSTTNAAAASLASNYVLSTPPNRAGKVKRIRLNRVRFDATTDVVSLFPRTRLSAHGTYQLVIRGQAVGPVTIVFNRAGIISESV